jgi:hypothetical protein
MVLTKSLMLEVTGYPTKFPSMNREGPAKSIGAAFGEHDFTFAVWSLFELKIRHCQQKQKVQFH